MEGEGPFDQTNIYTLHLFFIFWLLCLHYVADLTKTLELRLMVVSVLLKISVPKIGTLMSKRACINP